MSTLPLRKRSLRGQIAYLLDTVMDREMLITQLGACVEFQKREALSQFRAMAKNRMEWMRTEPKYAHTWDWDEHPDGYDEPCMCATCRSYADA